MISNHEEMQEAMFREKALLEIRRPTKDVLYYSEMLEPIIEHLKEDKKLLELLELVKMHLEDKKDFIEDRTYFVKQSNLLRGETKPYKRFRCKVLCYNLYGNKNISELNKDGGIWARDKEDAKEKFKRWIETTFDTVTYKEKDIVIEDSEY